MEPAVSHGDLKGVSVCAYLQFWRVQGFHLQVNILMTSSGRACIADFGIVTARDPHIQMTTTSSGIVGTLNFMAPELLAAESAADVQKLDRRRCDMYALACVCYEVGKRVSSFGLIHDKTCRCSLGVTRLKTGRISSPPYSGDNGRSGHVTMKSTKC